MCQIGLILVLLSAHIQRVSVSRMRDFFDGFPQISAKSLSYQQLEINLKGFTSWSNLTKFSVAIQDYINLHLSYIPEIPGGPKCTFTSPQTFKLSSGEPKVTPLVT